MRVPLLAWLLHGLLSGVHAGFLGVNESVTEVNSVESLPWRMRDAIDFAQNGRVLVKGEGLFNFRLKTGGHLKVILNPHPNCTMNAMMCFPSTNNVVDVDADVECEKQECGFGVVAAPYVAFVHSRSKRYGLTLGCNYTFEMLAEQLIAHPIGEGVEQLLPGCTIDQRPLADPATEETYLRVKGEFGAHCSLRIEGAKLIVSSKDVPGFTMPLWAIALIVLGVVVVVGVSVYGVLRWRKKRAESKSKSKSASATHPQSRIAAVEEATGSLQGNLTRGLSTLSVMAEGAQTETAQPKYVEEDERYHATDAELYFFDSDSPKIVWKRIRDEIPLLDKYLRQLGVRFLPNGKVKASREARLLIEDPDNGILFRNRLYILENPVRLDDQFWVRAAQVMEMSVYRKYALLLQDNLTEEDGILILGLLLSETRPMIRNMHNGYQTYPHPVPMFYSIAVQNEALFLAPELREFFENPYFQKPDD